MRSVITMELLKVLIYLYMYEQQEFQAFSPGSFFVQRAISIMQRDTFAGSNIGKFSRLTTTDNI